MDGMNLMLMSKIKKTNKPQQTMYFIRDFRRKEKITLTYKMNETWK